MRLRTLRHSHCKHCFSDSISVVSALDVLCNIALYKVTFYLLTYLYGWKDHTEVNAAVMIITVIHCYVLSLSGEHDSDSHHPSFLFISVCTSLHRWVTYAPVFCHLCLSGTVSYFTDYLFHLTCKQTGMSCCSCLRLSGNTADNSISLKP